MSVAGSMLFHVQNVILKVQSMRHLKVYKSSPVQCRQRAAQVSSLLQNGQIFVVGSSAGSSFFFLPGSFPCSWP